MGGGNGYGQNGGNSGTPVIQNGVERTSAYIAGSRGYPAAGAGAGANQNGQERNGGRGPTSYIEGSESPCFAGADFDGSGGAGFRGEVIVAYQIG